MKENAGKGKKMSDAEKFAITTFNNLVDDYLDQGLGVDEILTVLGKFYSDKDIYTFMRFKTPPGATKEDLSKNNECRKQRSLQETLTYREKIFSPICN